MMVSAITNALSGLAAATQRVNVSATNIANQESSGYTPQQVVQSSQATGGVTTHVTPVTPPSVQVGGANGLTSYPNVDPAQQLVQAQTASYDAQGNIDVLKVQSKLFDSVLNIIS